MFKGNILGLVLVGLISVSCGQGTSNNDDGPKLGPITYSENAILIEKQDPIICDGSLVSAQSRNSLEITIDQLIGDFTYARAFDFSKQVLFFESETEGQIENVLVLSPTLMPIKITKFGEYTSENKTIYYNKSLGSYDLRTEKSTSSPKIIKGRKDLNICLDTEAYNRNTYEAAGLNISYSITKTYEKLIEVDPNISLKAVTVNVVPYQEVVYTFRGGGDRNRKRQAFYETDNAYYHPTKLEIVFLPQGEENSSANPFWEVPMVASHEYGHHVFGSLALRNDKSDLKNSFVRCFETHQTHANKDLKQSVSTSVEREDNGIVFAIRSMNEGFSDLISFYTLDNDERSLKGVDCFRKNREVDSMVFGDGTVKNFSGTILKSINSSFYDEKDSDCNTPDFQAIHHIGAVFANVVDRLLISLDLSKDEKLKAILGFAKELGEMKLTLASFDGAPAGDIIFYSTEIILKHALSLKNIKPSNEQCKLLDSYFDKFSSPRCKYLFTE